MSQPFNLKEAPQSLPAKIPPPLFDLGTNVCWNCVSGGEPDCGMVVGMRYIWSKYIPDWQYQYYIALYADSPSYLWAKFDWGWQEDLTLISVLDSSSTSEKKK